jgi:hypothetical protein
MEKKELEQKLQHGYREMLNNISDFIEKEGKSVKEAVDAAENKLSEWQELSREEVVKVSTEVRNDIGKFGETWEEAKGSFQQKLSLDTEYIKESVWDKLSGIANNATLDFIEFQKDLKQRVGDAVDDLSQNKEKEHTDWRIDNEKWLTEIYLWQQEHQDAEEKLQLIDDMFYKHRENLHEHSQRIFTQMEDDSEYDHKEMRQLHKKEAELHQQLDQEQKEAIVLIDRLYKSFNKNLQ